MILGIGTDICQIGRIERALERFGDRFTHKIFTKHERNYCEARSGRAHYYAKRFAAKEATAKALAGRETGSLSWQDVEVRNDPSGRPVLHLYKGAQERLLAHLPEGYEPHLHLSLTDDPPHAMAFVIIDAVPKSDKN